MYTQIRTLLSCLAIVLGMSLSLAVHASDKWVEGVVVMADSTSGRLMVHGVRHQGQANVDAKDCDPNAVRKAWNVSFPTSEKEISGKAGEFSFSLTADAKVGDGRAPASGIAAEILPAQPAGPLAMAGVKAGDRVIVSYTDDATLKLASQVIVVGTDAAETVEPSKVVSVQPNW